jgi:hypothetical protein
MKTISQNPERYSKQGTNWVISASPAITPIYLPIGVELQNLKPLIKANGIVVKVGDNYLCSLETLNLIKESNNPHYDIVENGKLKVKDKEVVIGKTIKIIELNLNNLTTIIDGREFMNRQSGVTSVSYINNQRDLVDGVSKGVIDQINYTLDRDSQRPSDKFEVVDYSNMVNPKTNPTAGHYTIKPIRVITDQQETIFDPKRLQTFIIELSNQLKLLRNDFNQIQKTFFEGIIPTPNLYGLIMEDKIADTDVDDVDSNHSYRTGESSLISVEPPPVQSVNDNLQTTEAELTNEINLAEKNLQEKSIRLEEELRRAQQGDLQAQQTIQQELNRTKKQLVDIQKKLEE